MRRGEYGGLRLRQQARMSYRAAHYETLCGMRSPLIGCASCGLYRPVLRLPRHSPSRNLMNEDRDLFVPVELERRVDLVAPRPPNRDHSEDQRVNELEGLTEGEVPRANQPGVEQPGGEDSAAL